MRTIKELVGKEEKVYIVLKDKATQLRFQSEAEKEGITFGDGAKPTDRPVDDIMALKTDSTICFLGWAGRMCYHNRRERILRVDYDKYVNGESDYVIVK